MVIKTFIFSILPTIWLLSSVVSSAPTGPGILSQLYQRAVDEHRPLVLVLDAENGHLQQNLEAKSHKARHINQKSVKQTSEPSNVPEDAIGDNEVDLLKTLIKKISALVQNHGISFPWSTKTRGPKPGLRTKEQLVAPLIRGLLRVSNDMNCAARDKCEDEGDTRNECERKFECDEEEKTEKAEKAEKETDNCAIDDGDPCGDDDELQSTKGYTLEPEDENNCPRC